MFAPYENLMYLHIHPLLVKGRVCSREMEPVCGEPYHARRVFSSDVSLGDLLIFVSIAFILHFYYFTKFMKDSNIPISNSTCHLF